MTQVHWATARNGNFNKRKDWTPTGVPNSQDDAILDAAGKAFTVTANTNESVASIQTSANATLDITGFGIVFQAATGTGSGGNAGSIEVGDRSTLMIGGGTVNNSGAIALSGTTGNTYLDLPGSVTLTGGGAIVLSDSGYNLIANLVSGTTSTLVNVDNTISGAGYIGALSNPGVLDVVNQVAGVIDATGAANRLTVESATLINDGLLEATGSAGLFVFSGILDDIGGGVVMAANGSNVILGTDVEGGTLKTAGSGVILLSQGAVLDGSVSAVNNLGLLEVTNQVPAPEAKGTINNTGTIALTGTQARLTGASSASLFFVGGGQIALGDQRAGMGGFTNIDNTISGGGEIDGFVNDANGVILQTGAGQLSLDGSIANAGLIEAEGSGGLIFGAYAYPQFVNTGVVEAADGAQVQLPKSTRNDGSLLVDGGTLVDMHNIAGAGSATIAAGTLEVAFFTEDVAFTGATGDLLVLKGYVGTISGFSTAGGTSVDARSVNFDSSQLSFKGNAKGGTLTITDGAHTVHVRLAGDYEHASFVAADDGHGGTIVDANSDASTAPSLASPHLLVAAMASLGPSAGALDRGPGDRLYANSGLLAAPRTALA